MKIKAARVCLFLATMFFVMGVMMLCYCPGEYILSALLAMVPAIAGARLIRFAGIAIVVASIIAGILSYQAEQRLQQKVRHVHEMMERNYSRPPTNSPAPSTNSNGAHLTQDEVIRIAAEAAKKSGYNLENYKEPEAHYEFTRKDKTWSVFYDGKVPRPGNHFFVSVKDGTKETSVMPGE